MIPDNSRQDTAVDTGALPPLQLTVSFPAVDGYLRVCRLNTSAFAAGLGFSVDAIDDLKLAVAEAISWLLSDNSAAGTISLAFSETASSPNGSPGLRLVATRTNTAGPCQPQPVGELADAILGAVVDSHSLVVDGASAVATLEKVSDAEHGSNPSEQSTDDLA